jgi:hypothetical protein
MYTNKGLQKEKTMNGDFSEATNDPTRRWQDCVPIDKRQEAYEFLYKVSEQVDPTIHRHRKKADRIGDFGDHFTNEGMSTLIFKLAASPELRKDLCQLLAFGIHVDTHVAPNLYESYGKTALQHALDAWDDCLDRKWDDNKKRYLTKHVHDTDMSAIDTLLEYRANPNIRDFNGDSAFGMVAIRCGESGEHKLLLAKLIRAGADVNAQDSGGETALMEAIRIRSPGSAAYLCTLHGTNLDIRNFEGHTAEEIAKNLKEQELSEIAERPAGGKRTPAAATRQGFIDTLDEFLAAAEQRRNTGGSALPLQEVSLNP